MLGEKTMLSNLRRLQLLLLALPFALPGFISVAQAQDQGADELIEEIVTTGTRRAARSVTQSMVPIDVITAEDMISQGATDMDSLLRGVVPSYNVNAQAITDAATIIRPANLRGLPADNTLILVNGKRFHRGAVISFFGGGISDGSQGPDLTVIPGIAVKQVEVLRDGASAQYGSDAIAGVINFKLRDNAQGLTVEGRYGEFAEGDGQTQQIAANLGLPLTDVGYFNLSVEFKDSDPTSRSVQRDDAAALIAAGNTDVINPVQIWGSPKIDDDFKVWANAAIELDNNGEAYIFGNWAERDVTGGFFFRNPNTRGGIFSGDDGATILVADLTFGSQDDGIPCPVVNVVNDVPDATALAAVAADPNCFAFNELEPGGFTPQFGGAVTDASITGGFRGELANGLLYDISASYGRNAVVFKIINTVNGNLASLQLDTPRAFRPGSYVQSERNVNVDVSYPVAVDAFASPLNVAGGLEYRTEQFEIKNGDRNSFFIDNDLAQQGFGIGSNGFPGFKSEDAGVNSRDNFAAYIDLEADITDRFMAGIAVRFENFTDFGSTTNAKLAGRLQITDGFAVRASASTGFRAPTVGQANVRNVTTSFAAGVLVDEATLPPTDPISVQKGGKPLRPEESVNLAIGAILSIGNLDLTIDYFNVNVEDRISTTSTLELSQQDIDDLLAQGVTDASSFFGVKFFTNDFETTTQGIDVVATLPIGDNTELTFNGNWTDTEVDKFNPEIVTAARIRQLEDGNPDVRFSLTGTHNRNNWRGLVRVNYFGEYFEDHVDSGIFPIEAGAEFTVDAEIGYTFNDSLTIVLGAQNLLDEEPDLNPWASSIVGAKFPVTSPMGFNGGFYYARVSWDVF
ncbi:MAG: TonB-dependent receptor [Proteobacteria bacterium]|nr:TonB-dependent receptor [Pseudomonadota bacterium]